MTHAINRVAFLVIIIFASNIHLIQAQQYAPTNEIVSNDIYSLAGDSAILWMLSSKGINYTTFLTENNVQWNGYKDLSGFSCIYGNGNVIALLHTTSQPNSIWYYNNITKSHKTITLDYQVDKFNDSCHFIANDAIWVDSAFWITSYEGGLIRMDKQGVITGLFYPGKDSITYTMANYTPDILDIPMPDHDRRAVSVAASNNQIIWVACEKALYSFEYKNNIPLWTKINETIPSLLEYYEIEIKTNGDTTKIFALATLTGTKKDSTNLQCFTYDTNEKKWHRFIKNYVVDIELGNNDYVYIVDDQNRLRAYRDTIADTSLDFNTAYVKMPLLENPYFIKRLPLQRSFEIKDIHYSNGFFQIGTNIGLFYSNNELCSIEHDTAQFRYAGRSVPLSNKLKKVYAYPSIITNHYMDKHPIPAVFAYNLEKDDHVTIEIFDYNMDYVTTIINSEFRYAGKHNSSGRSTNPDRDQWNGNVLGKPAVPGVYYFRIKTKEGERAFGKVIVARN